MGSDGVFSGDSYSRNARTPVMRGGNLNPGAVRQISSGSIVGKLFCVSMAGRGDRVVMLMENRVMCRFAG
jgi:hypothetical protein